MAEKIEGLGEVRDALVAVPIELRRKVMVSLLRKAAQPIVRAAKANAPVAKKATRRVVPGLIRKTIGVARSKIHNGAGGVFGVFIKPIKPAGVKRITRQARRAGAAGPNFGDPYYYAFQEAGFHAVGRRKAGGSRQARAERVKASGARFISGLKFMGRAFESQRGAAVGIFRTDVVEKIIESFSKRTKR